MSFTAINTGDFCPDTIVNAILELGSALYERELALGLSPSSLGSFEVHIPTRCVEFISDIRPAIENLIADGHDEDAKFLKTADYSEYVDADDLLDEAGYPSGWISTTDYAVSDPAIWNQLFAVFGELYKHRRVISPDSPSVPQRTGSEAVYEDAWDEAVAATPGTLTAFPSLKWHSLLVGPSTRVWELNGPVYDLSFPTGGIVAAQVGVFDECTIEYCISSSRTASQDSVITVVLMSGAVSKTINPSGANDETGGSIVRTTGFTFGIDYVVDAEITTTEPSSAPWPQYANAFFWLSGNSGSAPGDIEFRFDITSILTYG